MKELLDKINANETVKFIIIFEAVLLLCVAVVGVSWKMSRNYLAVKKPSIYAEQDKILHSSE